MRSAPVPPGVWMPTRRCAVLVASAENIGLQQFDIGDVALRAEIALAVLRVEQDALGALDRAHDRRVACFVAIDADAEIDLSRSAGRS